MTGRAAVRSIELKRVQVTVHSIEVIDIALPDVSLRRSLLERHVHSIDCA